MISLPGLEIQSKWRIEMDTLKLPCPHPCDWQVLHQLLAQNQKSHLQHPEEARPVAKVGRMKEYTQFSTKI